MCRSSYSRALRGNSYFGVITNLLYDLLMPPAPEPKTRWLRPAWWPANEPWPPQDERAKRRFALRLVAALAVLSIVLVFACSVPFALGMMLANHIGFPDRPGPMPPVDMMPGAHPWGRWDGTPFFPFALCGWLFFGFVVFAILSRLARRTVYPVRDVMNAATRVEKGDYSARVPERGIRDVRALARTFNTMTERLERTDAQRKRLLADVTHELRTPLTIIQGNLEGVIDGVYPRDDAYLQAALDETRVMSRLIDDLRTLSLAEAGTLKLQREPIDPDELIADVVRSFGAQAKKRAVALVHARAAQPVTLELDPTRIREVLANLITNALRHTPGGGRIALSTALRARDGAKMLAISVVDTGSGFASVDLEHIFDRFYTSADSGGTGLGLAIARGIVEAHGGRISAHNGASGGARVEFELPM
jgi:signal transduction histidine kinase